MLYKLLTYLFLFVSLLGLSQSPFEAMRENNLQANYHKSLLIADSCLTKNYQKDSALFYKGLTYLKMDNLKLAKKNCQLLLKSFPEFSDAHYLLGLIYFTNQNYASSVDEFSKVLKTNSKHLKARYNRSIAFGLLEDYLYAIEDLSMCIQLNPNYSLAYYSRAYWYEYTGNYAESIKDYLSVIRLDEKNYDAYLGLAYVYQNQKETLKACETIQSAILAGSQIAEDVKDSFCH